MFIKLTYVFSFFFCIINSCHSKEHTSTPIRLIDDNIPTILEQLESSQLEKTPLKLSSRGGYTSSSLKVAMKIKANAIHMIVDNECTSNCAEILLPFADKITFEKQPIIGLHGNDFSYRHYVSELASKNRNFCNWSYSYQIENQLISKSMRTDFWKEQMKRLKPSVEFKYDNQSCPWRLYNFENHMWLPTSQQLRKLWGLKFSGSVCADDFEKCTSRINQRWRKGTRIVIGDEVYVSKGR